MADDSRKNLYDILEAAKAVGRFTQGRTGEDLERDELLQSGIQRKLEIIGEALGRIKRSDPKLLEGIRDHRDIISLRNILIHGYDAVDHRIIRNIVEEDIGMLVEDVEKILFRIDRNGDCPERPNP